jgi:gamma-glutamyl:cysteine ligase YbdK (ATP-grasp superfamily)
LHVIELKTTNPTNNLLKAAESFHKNILLINKMLSDEDSLLMPSAAHPWMNPFKESKIWPHESNEIYEMYNKIFDCKGHGWSNLQSVHLNLPFSGDKEFKKLHSAIRILLPILPGIAASSPIIEGKFTGFSDSRLNFYKENQRKVPTIAGKIVPEYVESKKDYNEKILNRMFKEISIYDPKGILQEEWLNSRGAIARFERNAIEIRVLDIQECPEADVSIVYAIVEILKKLVNEEISKFDDQKNMQTQELHEIFIESMKKGEGAIINNKRFLKCLGFEKDECSSKELWKYLIERCIDKKSKEAKIFLPYIRNIIENGTLSTRIKNRLGKKFDDKELKKVYRDLCVCLVEGRMFK